MTTEPQAQTSERERQRAWLKSQPLYSVAHNVLETMDADAAQIRSLKGELQKWREGTSAQRAEDVRTIHDLQAKLAAREADAERLDTLAAEYWKLDPFEMPTGAGDADVGWRVVQYHQGMPPERTVAEVYADDPRKAIDAAIAATHAPRSEAGEDVK